MKWHHDKKRDRHVYPCRTLDEALNALRERIPVQGAIRLDGITWLDGGHWTEALIDDTGRIATLMSRRNGWRRRHGDASGAD